MRKCAHDGTPVSPGDDEKDALDVNAQWSYWMTTL